MIASVSAKPSHWIEVISSRISGWRVTDSMTLPKMKPTPMPGPMVPRPAPMPSAIALPALRPYSWGSAAWAICVMTDRSTSVAPLVLRGDGAAEVDRGQGGEDEGLQGGDQAHLEEEDRGARGALDASGDPALEIADEALRPDALDVVAEPDHDRQHERDGEVRG